MSNYGTKPDLKNTTGVDTSQFAKKDDLANVKIDDSRADKLDIDKFKKVPSRLNSFNNKIDQLGVDKLKPVPVYLKKFNNVVETKVVKKRLYNELIKKVNVIDANELVKKQIIMLKLMRLKVKYVIL